MLVLLLPMLKLLPMLMLLLVLARTGEDLELCMLLRGDETDTCAPLVAIVVI